MSRTHAKIEMLFAGIHRLETMITLAELKNAAWNKQVLMIVQTSAQEMRSQEGWKRCDETLKLLREELNGIRERLRALGTPLIDDDATGD